MSRHRAIIFVELGLAFAIFLGANYWTIVPISETPWIFLLGWISLRMRGTGWRSVGLVRPPNWTHAVGIALVAAVGLQLLSEYVTEPLIASFTHQPTNLSRFRPLVADLKLVFMYLGLVWILAAFGEELVYRGYILNRAAEIGSQKPRAWIVSYLAVSLLFGFGHMYQGPTGIVDSTISGLILGGLYLSFGKNLWIPILTHGISDTIGLFLIYFDLAPAVYR